MTAACPKCQKKYNLDESKLPDSGAKLRCAQCRTIFLIRKKSATGRIARVETPAGYDRWAVVANSDPAICNTIEEILIRDNIGVIKTFNGIEALQAVENKKPHVAVLDVYLPEMYGFEVCEHIKNHELLKATKIILMASIYDKTRYKRNPVSLYGADDYIEKHHLHDDLIPKINRLMISQEKAVPAGSEIEAAEEEKIQTEEIATPVQTMQEVDTLSAGEKTIDDADIEAKDKARRLARIIVSDIALYSADLITEGIKSGTLYSLIKDDLREGLEHYKKKVPPFIRAEEFLKAAFEEFVSKRKKEMGLP